MTASPTATAAPAENPRPLLVTAVRAAEMLGIGQRTLWSLTDAGDLPCVRIGRSVRYSVADLETWIDRQRDASSPRRRRRRATR